MKRTIYLQFFSLPISFLLFSACHARPHANTQFNAYTPPSFEDFNENFTEFEFPENNNEDAPIPDVWEYRDLDVSYVQKDRKLLSFTFDDAPSTSFERILAVFTAYNEANPDCIATATVFFNGTRIDEQSFPLLHAAAALGFELGNHTHSHYDLTSLSPARLNEEIRLTDELLQRVDGKPYHLLRAPFGKLNEEVKKYATAPFIDWTIDTLDWTGKSTDEIFDSVFSARASGSIVLMHDGYNNTVEALKRLLPALKAENYQVVSVSALAKAHDCPLKRGSVYIRARKQT